MSDKIREALNTFLDLGIDEDKAAETWPEIASALKNARAALAQQPAPVAVPDGWRLVPAEPTMNMLECIMGWRESGNASAYRAMLAAAPAAPAVPVAVGQEPVAWIAVVGFEGVYEVSNQGAVRRKDTGSSLKLKAKAGSGYVKCTLHSSGQRVQTYLHRVVCEAFNGPANGREVNHIDGDKENNKAENLEWVSRSENVNHSYYTLGNQIGAVVGTNDHGESVEYRSVEEAVRAGFDSAHIYRCLNNPHKKHKGYRWYRPAPPAAKQPDTIPVRKDLLERTAILLEWDGSQELTAMQFAARADRLASELRALLAGGEA